MRATAVRPAATAVLLAVVTALGACRSQSSPPRSAPPPPGPAVVDVDMGEYRFHYGPDVPAGRVVFRVRNVGRLEHHVTLLPLAEDVPPINVQVSGSTRRAVAPFAGIHTRRPGASGTFAVDLVEGRRYALLCSVRDADGTSHARKGMASEFRAGRRAGGNIERDQKG